MIKTNEEKDTLSCKADSAFIQVSHKVIKLAKQTGTPIILWKDGKVIEVSAEEMELRMKSK